MQLILVRHSIPIIDTSKPPAEWQLSDSGVRAVSGVADSLRAHNMSMIYSSEEPKAAGTARELARLFQCGWTTRPGLHEHERERMDWAGNETRDARIREFFERPSQLVFGLETADQAHDRFQGAVEALVQSAHAGPLVIVSHGTVISLFLARLRGVEPYSIWRTLQLPDHVEVDYPASN